MGSSTVMAMLRLGPIGNRGSLGIRDLWRHLCFSCLETVETKEVDSVMRHRKRIEQAMTIGSVVQYNRQTTVVPQLPWVAIKLSLSCLG